MWQEVKKSDKERYEIYRRKADRSVFKQIKYRIDGYWTRFMMEESSHEQYTKMCKDIENARPDDSDNDL
jgi:hypothetical protein